VYYSWDYVESLISLCILFIVCLLYTVLVFKEFVDMTKIRIERMLATFPKLNGNGKQHTYVELENVCYVCQ
jgi:hypothetical protein